MIRSMFTAISSLQLHQKYMDVIADNLANANTYAFKANRFSFQDQYSQLMSAGSAPTDAVGGTNPLQIGLGTRMGAISPTFTQGSLQATGRNTDLAIQGDGFLIYNNGTKNLYSRDGQLELDADGYLVHGPTGNRIQGWMAAAGVVNNDGALEDIQLPIGSSLAQVTSAATLAGNLDSSTAVGASTSATIGVYDSLGQTRSVPISFTKTGANTWTWAAGAPATSGGGSITFTAEGQFSAVTATAVGLPDLNGSGAFSVDLDLASLTQLATASDASMTNQNGLAAGSLTTFFVSADTAEIYGLYSNGMQQLVGQLGLAKFVNPSGLLRSGQNMYDQGINSGDASVGTAHTGGRGVVVSNHLEGSNVDMAQEFTNMILAQRGFQASSRVITTSDEMLQELVNIKR
jgi:flagellar hook protein FlgE